MYLSLICMYTSYSCSYSYRYSHSYSFLPIGVTMCVYIFLHTYTLGLWGLVFGRLVKVGYFSCLDNWAYSMANYRHYGAIYNDDFGT